MGDIVTFRAPVTRVASSRPIGFMTGSLQLVIGGAAEYPLDAPTLPQRSTTTRPIIGGSGRYAGARGWAVTIHTADDQWRHTFHFTG